MAGLNPEAARAAVKATVDAASLVRKLAVFDYPPGNDPDVMPNYPCLIVRWAQGPEYQLTFGAAGLTSMVLELELRTMAVDGRSAEKVMDDFLAAGDGATSSIVDVFFADPTLGGVVGNATCLRASAPAPMQVAIGSWYWSTKYLLTIYNHKGTP